MGREVASLYEVRLGGPGVRKARAGYADLGEGAQVDLCRDSSIAPLVDVRRRLRAVPDIIGSIGRSDFSVARGLGPTRQWDNIVGGGPMGTVTAEQLVEVSGLGLAGMEAAVGRMHQDLDKLLHCVVVQRKSKAVQGWRAWILEDPLVHPERWLRPDLVPLRPSSSVILLARLVVLG